jgi:hypothetical protein
VAEDFHQTNPPYRDFIDGAEFDLYRDVTRFVGNSKAKAAAQVDDPRARAVGFLMSLYQSPVLIYAPPCGTKKTVLKGLKWD